MSILFAFDGKNPEAQRIAERQATQKLTKAITQEQRKAIRVLIVRSIREGIPVDKLARMIRKLIGLDNRQIAAVLNLRRKLEGRVSEEVLEKTVNRYAKKKLAERANRIARTEIMGALNGGMIQAGKQAVQKGLLEYPIKTAMTTPDEITCDICRPMDEVQVPLNEAFQTPVGPAKHPPFHVQCRCSVSLSEGAIIKPRKAA